MQDQVRRIELALKNIFPEQWTLPDQLEAAMFYSLLAGGKRLRPMLVLSSAEALGDFSDKAMPAACAIELIHAYSLIHDDLPAMDDDDYRRGKLTNHKVYGEAMAILAGDGLLTHAFYTLVQCFRQHDIPTDRVLMMVEGLAEAAGARGMVGGQVADIEGEQGVLSLQELESIHARKTGSLIVFSLRAGGIIGGASEGQLQALTEFGSRIGLAFQIQDDVLDLIGDEKKLGKALKSDEKSHKATYPYFLGIDACMEKIKELTNEGKQAIIKADFPYPDRLLQLADFLIHRDH